MTEAEKQQMELLQSQVEDLSQRLYDLEVQPGLAATLRWFRSRMEDLHDRYGSCRRRLQRWSNMIINKGLRILK